MKKRQFWAILYIGLLAFLLPAHAQVTTVINTLNNFSPTLEPFGDPLSETKYSPELAQAFTTPDRELTLTAVQVTLKLWRGEPNPANPNSNFSVRIRADDAGVPGQIFLTLDGPPQPLINQRNGTLEAPVYTGSMTLSPNSTYWVNVIDPTASITRYGWLYAASGYVNTGLGTLGPQAAGELSSFPNEPYWKLNEDANLPGGAFYFSIIAVPEASFTSLAAAIALSLFFAVQRCRK